jgi:hypothetical protein
VKRCLPFILGCAAYAFAAEPARVLQLPYGSRTELASPDRRFVLYGLPYQHGVREGPELWIRNRRTGERRLLLQVSGTARAEWAPDGSAFYIADRLASDSALSYVYDADGRKPLDVRDILLKADPRLQPFATGHVYVNTVKWLDSRTLLVSWFGHTDDAPVRCFQFRYKVDRTGKVRKLSGRVSPVTDRGCP